MSDLHEELAGKRSSLRKLERQAVDYGGKQSAPLHIWNGIDRLEEEIAALEAQLGIVRPATPAYTPRSISDEEHARKISDQQRAARQSDIDHQLKLLQTYRGNLAHYIRQARAYGSIDLAPPMTGHGIAASRAGVTAAKRALFDLGVEVENLPGDE